MKENFKIKNIIIIGVLILAAAFALGFKGGILQVSAQIEETILAAIENIGFGTVFPQESFDRTFEVTFSESANQDETLNDVEYTISQRPKCWNNDAQSPVFGKAVDDGQGNFICEDEGFVILPLLCPYLSKTELTADGEEGENDSVSVSAFHGLPGPWDVTTAFANQVSGRIIKSANDLADTWNLDFKVPCFAGQCAQDWENFVASANPEANATDYELNQSLRGALFGCDLWLEITATSSPPGPLCRGPMDLMLVIDHSGSISAPDFAVLQTAAVSFINALEPSPTGVHVGVSAFAATGTLVAHLSDSTTTAITGINALTHGGPTNLSAGISLATGELDDGHVHERPAIVDVMVVLTDGRPNRPTPVSAAEAAATSSAAAAQTAGIEMFVVAIGASPAEAFLKDNFASPPTNDHYFDASDINTLESILVGLTCNPD
jgi:uncharacterized protein YegL